MTEQLLFIIVGAIALVSAGAMIATRNAIHSALFLIVNFICVAFLFLLLEAPFLAMVQVAVYAGAIMVLFLFVIMLLGAERTTDSSGRLNRLSLVVMIFGLVFLGVVGLLLIAVNFGLPEPAGETPLVRVVQAAPDVGMVKVTIDGEVVASDIHFGQTSNYLPVAAGKHVLGIADSATGAEVLRVDLDLVANSRQSVIAYGSGLDLTTALLEDDLSNLQDDRGARMVVFNAYSETPVSLIDLGADRELTILNVEAVSKEGTPLVDENGNIAKVDELRDKVYVSDVAFGTASEAFTVPEGIYTVSWTTLDTQDMTVYESREVEQEDADGNTTTVLQADTEAPFTITSVTGTDEVRRERSFTVERATAQMVVLTAERLVDDTVRPYTLALTDAALPPFGGPHIIGQVLFTKYVLPMQMVGVLLLVAIIGAIVLTKREDEPAGRRLPGRHKVSRPLTSVIATQTGHDVSASRPELEAPEPETAPGD